MPLAFHAADHALFQRRCRCPEYSVPGSAKMPFMPVRALGAPHTTWIHARIRSRPCTAAAVGIGMLHRLDDIGHLERRQQLRLVLDLLDLKANADQPVDDLARARPSCRDDP